VFYTEGALTMDIAGSISRREFVLGAGAVLAVVGGLVPRLALATPEAAKDLLLGLVKGTQPKEGRITLKAPEIAENGNTVPVSVVVESPMTEQDYVKAVHVVAVGNPLPGVITLRFRPENGKAEAQFRMRLAQTQNLVAVAEMSDGSLWTATREIKVTIGGCGG
jgi:sulfur-oxidizing protein SoxY